MMWNDRILSNKNCCSTEAVEPVDVEPSSSAAPKTRSRKNMTDEDFEELPTENIDWEQLGAENRELLRDWSQRKEQELIDVATQCQHASSVCPVGRDRFFRCYWVFRSIPGLFVEEYGDAVTAASESSRNSDAPPGNKSPTDDSSEQPPTRWSFYGSVDDVERLLASLNSRGFREGPLKAVLVDQHDRLKDWVGQCDVDALSVPVSVNETKNMSNQCVENESLVAAVREMILDLEERVYSGSLGSLKVRLSTTFTVVSCSSSSSSSICAG